MTSVTAELASGKGHKDENFPVGSWVLRREVRAPVMAFYRFARAADDVSDHAQASPDTKLRLFATMRATLDGQSDEDANARHLRDVLEDTRVPLTHAHDLLTAFERDVTKLRYHDWDDLMDYCRYSAMPVGRFMLDIHGEAKSLWPQSDALCAALQIINHLQDCGEDRTTLDRIYLPLDIMAEYGAHITDLDADRASPALRGVIKHLAQRTMQLLDDAHGFSPAVTDWRLGVEIAVIDALARDLTQKLITRDPLSQPVHHSKWAMAGLATSAALRRLVIRR
jgi:squalene synthase HpnC